MSHDKPLRTQPGRYSLYTVNIEAANQTIEMLLAESTLLREVNAELLEVITEMSGRLRVKKCPENTPIGGLKRSKKRVKNVNKIK